ncbi:MAG: hypothetical protein JWM02_3672 [Frankiales bacterium]|nr:hypothetical protein [Frankiales bacterium]
MTDDSPGRVQSAHDLVISYGDAEFHAACRCGRPLLTIRPNESFDLFGPVWEAHVMSLVDQ